MEIHTGDKETGRSHEAEGSNWEQTQQREGWRCRPGLGSSGYSWWLSDKESTCNAVASGDAGSIHGLGRCRRAWRSTVQRVTKSQTWLKQLIMHAHTGTRIQGNTYEGCSWDRSMTVRTKFLFSAWLHCSVAERMSCLSYFLMGP